IYSNSNYVLLAIIIERASNSSLSEFSNKYIFVPSGMKNTEWRDDFKKVVSNRATAYFKSGSVYVTEMLNESSYGHAGLLTTAEDLIRWNDYYLSGRLGNPSLLLKQLATGLLNNGKATVYAAGLSVSLGNDLKRIGHAGLTAGYRANLEYFPQFGLSIAWLSNNSQPEVLEITTAVRNLIIKTPQLKADTSIALNTFRQFAGVYREEKTGAFLKLVMEENGIFSQSIGPSQPLRPMSNNTLIMGSQMLTFPSQNTKKALLISSSGDTAFFTGIDPAKLDTQLMKEYTGEYTSEEIEGKLVIINRNGKLVVKLRPDIELPFLAAYRDGFYFRFQNQSTGMSFIVNFERDTRQRITGFVISERGVRKIRYQKKERNKGL
ncbi:MAG: serine hydrolase domain-containing protein, partial [Chitinophagaceae bacterium]